MMKILKIVSFIVGLTLIAGCPQKNETSQANAAGKEQLPVLDKERHQQIKERLVNKELSYRGTVKYFNLEGGFFGIVTDKGQKFLPQGLSREMLTDGAEIEFSGPNNERRDDHSAMGHPFKISNAKLIKPGKPVKPGSKRSLE